MRVQPNRRFLRGVNWGTIEAMQVLPDDLQDVLQQIDAADRAADDMVSGLTDEQLHWQPDAGRAWSIAQCLEHLGKINRLYGDAVWTGVELARSRGWTRTGPIAPSIFGRWFIGSMEPPVRRKLRAPSQAQPGSTTPRDQILRRYHDAHESIRRLIAESADLDVNRATFRNPFISLVRVRVGTALLVIAAHDRRHLWQAEQVRRAPGFPGQGERRRWLTETEETEAHGETEQAPTQRHGETEK
jgi:hypothetical protein